jgi:hypothetical protein
MSANSEYVDTEGLAALTGVSASTWAKRRLTGDSPPYIKVGRCVRYHVPAAMAWIARHERRSTSDAGFEMKHDRNRMRRAARIRVVKRGKNGQK